MAFFEGSKMTAGYGNGPDIISSCSINVDRALNKMFGRFVWFVHVWNLVNARQLAPMKEVMEEVIGIIKTREIGEPGSEAYEMYNKHKPANGEIVTHEERMKVDKQFKEQGSIGMVEYYGPNDMKWENNFIKKTEIDTI